MMPADAVRIEYVAPEACPSADEFRSEVADRAPHARFAEGNALARTLVVKITSKRAGFHGSLAVREIDGTEAARSVDASTCPQLVTGLALIAAVAVDSKASNANGASATSNAGDGATANNATPTTSTTNGATTNGATSNGTSTTPVKQNQPEKKADPQSPGTEPKKNSDADRDDERDHVPSSPRSPHAFEFSFGVDGGLVGGMSPSVLPTLPLFVEIGRGRGHGIFTPSVRARFERPGGDADSSNQGSAHFTWTEGSVDLCPIAYAPIERLRLVPCVRTEVGVVDASGSGATPAREEVRPWALLGLVARARVDIVGPLFGEIEGDLGTPLVRDRFYLEPDFTVFRASAVAWSGAAGLGVSIW